MEENDLKWAALASVKESDWRMFLDHINAGWGFAGVVQYITTQLRIDDHVATIFLEHLKQLGGKIVIIATNHPPFYFSDSSEHYLHDGINIETKANGQSITKFWEPLSVIDA